MEPVFLVNQITDIWCQETAEVTGVVGHDAWVKVLERRKTTTASDHKKKLTNE